MSTQLKRFSQACENNKEVILAQLVHLFAKHKHVLEIGSGTGQHAVYFAKHLSHLKWYTADQLEYHDSIKQWIYEYPSENLCLPMTFTIPKDPWPDVPIDAVFSANTAHIMQRDEVKAMMRLIQRNLPAGGIFCQYGPFTQDGRFTSQSNKDFHHKLLASGRGGYREIEELQSWADELNLLNIIDMPANNHLLVWRK